MAYHRAFWSQKQLYWHPVAPKLVLTAAHCLFNGKLLVNSGNVRFLAGLNKGVPAAYSAARSVWLSHKNLLLVLRRKKVSQMTGQQSY